jgi:hypothetical protein
MSCVRERTWFHASKLLIQRAASLADGAVCVITHPGVTRSSSPPPGGLRRQTVPHHVSQDIDRVNRCGLGTATLGAM